MCIGLNVLCLSVHEASDGVQGCAGSGSPLMGCGLVTSPVSGTWVPHEHDLIFWAAQGLHWVSQV